MVNNQITPIPVTLDGKPHTVTVPLETIGYTAQSGTSLQLQLVATTVAYVTPQLGGSITFTRVRVVLPTARGLKDCTTRRGNAELDSLSSSRCNTIPTRRRCLSSSRSIMISMVRSPIVELASNTERHARLAFIGDLCWISLQAIELAGVVAHDPRLCLGT